MTKTKRSTISVLLACLVPFSIHSVDSLSAGTTRRRLLQNLATTTVAGVATPRSTWAADVDTPKQPFWYSNEWSGTLLPRLDLAQAVVGADGDEIWPMGRWPDPVLRIPAEPVAEELFGTDTLRRACDLLTQTARHHGAVGLAAQQCGVNARIIVLEKEKQQALVGKLKRRNADTDFVVMVNPKIISRSPEIDVRVWNERCLVLPPDFVATVVRDAVVDVQYRTADEGSSVHVLHLTGEPARAIQHELDHDRGILMTDHMGLSDMDMVMRQIEQAGHDERMALAFDRQVYEAS